MGCARAAFSRSELGKAVDGCLLGPDVVFDCLDVLLNESKQLLLAAAATLLSYNILKIIQIALIIQHFIEKQHYPIFEE